MLFLLGPPSVLLLVEVLEILATCLILAVIVLTIQHIGAHYLVKVLLSNEAGGVTVKTALCFLM
jgi:hypothetical protein